MRVTLECYGAIRGYLQGSEGREVEIEMPPGTVGDAVDEVGIPRRLVHAVLVDGSRGDLDTEVVDGSRVTLMPAFAGGC